MLSIDYPAPAFRIEKREGREYIFDEVRKKWLLLTPEEWVRQNFVNYLIRNRSYPATLIALEKMISLGELKKRFDILVYDTQHRPWMMIECKAPGIALQDGVLQQLLRYHITMKADYLVITNGDDSMGWQKTAAGLLALDQLPTWPF